MLDKIINTLGRVPQDKCMHYITGQIGAVVLLTLTKSIGWSAFGVLLVALWWELRDLRHSDPADVLATVVGGIPLYFLFVVCR